MEKDSKGGKTPFKEAKRDVHLTIDPAVFRLAKIECIKLDIDLSHATEQLWKLWVQGKVKVSVESE